MGAVSNDGGGSNSGHARVFDWNGSSWTQVGADINGEAADDYLGRSVSINDLGTRIVVGAFSNDGGGSNSGHARIYDLVGTTWTQVDDDIDGEEANDNLGCSVGISASGHRIAVGAYAGDNNSNVNTGHVKVFSVNNICTTPLSITITGSEDASFSYASTGYCTDDSDPTPAITGTTGGTFSSTAGLSLNASTGQIDLDASNPGSYDVTYTTSSNPCAQTSTQSITIAAPSVGFNYVGTTAFCTAGSDPSATITGTTGGTFTATPSGLTIDASTGTIDLSASTAATYDVTYTPPVLEQLGSDIDGVANADQFGYAVSMSNDGNRMVISAPADDSPGSNAGSVEVYEYGSGSWTKMGSTINGEATNDYFGSSVSINGAGDRIVVGANANDGNGSNSGHARVFDLVGTTWTQVDDDIDGEEAGDFLGGSVGISASGHRIAVGAYAGDNNSNVNTGHVKVFSVNNICTTPLSITITGSEDASFSYASTGYCTDDSDPTPAITGTTGGTFSSTAGLSLNASTGQIDLDASNPGSYDVTYTTSSNPCAQTSTQSITIAAPSVGFNYVGTTAFCTAGSDPSATITGTTGGTFTATPSGLTIDASTGTIDLSASTAATYDVTYTPPAIEQLGSDIDGVAYSDQFGHAVSMSNDGNRMVIGANYDDTPGSSAGSVEVYEYSSGSWTKMGSTINGEAAYDQSGYAVSMNGAGTRIVVGAVQNDGGGSNSGHARVFDWNGTAWTQVGADINGEAAGDEFGYAVSRTMLEIELL